MAAILVIADDLTGAAELGGVALRYNLTVEIGHAFIPGIAVDVQVVNTNTRSLSTIDAIAKINDLFALVDAQQFDFIYLKFDSALRGHIYREIESYQSLFKTSSVSFCPVNPAFGRVIRQGEYWIGDQRISQTSFADDPEFPILQDDVLKILGAENWHMLSVGSEPMPNGVSVFEVETVAEIQVLADVTKHRTVFAGAAAFFDALLTAKKKERNESVEVPELERPILYVCGSTHANSRQWLREQPDCYKLLWDARDFSVYERVIAMLKEKRKAIFAFADHVDEDALTLRKHLADAVKLIFDEYEIRELCLEGGATAYEILKELEIDTFTPVQELRSGVIRSKVKNKDLYVTLKPGSYQWSESLCIF